MQANYAWAYAQQQQQQQFHPPLPPGIQVLPPPPTLWPLPPPPPPVPLGFKTSPLDVLHPLDAAADPASFHDDLPGLFGCDPLLFNDDADLSVVSDGWETNDATTQGVVAAATVGNGGGGSGSGATVLGLLPAIDDLPIGGGGLVSSQKSSAELLPPSSASIHGIPTGVTGEASGSGSGVASVDDFTLPEVLPSTAAAAAAVADVEDDDGVVELQREEIRVSASVSPLTSLLSGGGGGGGGRIHGSIPAIAMHQQQNHLNTTTTTSNMEQLGHPMPVLRPPLRFPATATTTGFPVVNNGVGGLAGYQIAAGRLHQYQLHQHQLLVQQQQQNQQQQQQQQQQQPPLATPIPSSSQGQLSAGSALGKRPASDYNLSGAVAGAAAPAAKKAGTRRKTQTKRFTAAATAAGGGGAYANASSDEDYEDVQFQSRRRPPAAAAQAALAGNGIYSISAVGGIINSNGAVVLGSSGSALPARTSTRLQGRTATTPYRHDPDYITYDDADEPPVEDEDKEEQHQQYLYNPHQQQQQQHPKQQQSKQNSTAAGAAVVPRRGRGRAPSSGGGAKNKSGKRSTPSRAGHRTVPLAAQRIRATSARHESKGRPSFSEIVDAGFMKIGPHRFNVGNVEVAAVVGDDGAIMYAGTRYRAISKFALVVLRERNPTRQSCDGWREVTWNGEKLDALRMRVQSHVRLAARQRSV